MKHEDVKVGMKVVPHSKTAKDAGLDGSCEFNKAKKKAQSYLYVIRKNGDTGIISLASDRGSNYGDYFYAHDFEPYIEQKKEKTMSKLKMKVAVFEKAIAVQIFEMDERFRMEPEHRGNDCGIVKSRCHPELKEGAIYLRGEDRSRDLDIITRHFSSNGERDDFIIKMYRALTDWAENWEGWKEKKEESVTKDSDIWEF